MALIGQFAGQHQLQVAVLGIRRNRLARNVDGFVELVVVAIGVHFTLVAAHRWVAAQVDHLLVSGERLVGLVLLEVNRAQPLQEDAAIVLFFAGVGAVGVRGQIDHALVGLRRLIQPAQHIQQQALVVAGFERAGIELARLADGGQRVFVLALAALNLSNVHQRLRCFQDRPRPAP